MAIDRDTFYNSSKIAIVPMAFCYPGTGKGGDLPPRPECAEQWRKALLAKLKNIELTLVIGKYALDWHLGDKQSKTLTETVSLWQQHWPNLLPMPHPSPRNARWIKNNEWFAEDVLPALKKRVQELIKE